MYLSALLQLHLHSRLNAWLQWIRHRQLQDKTRSVYFLGDLVCHILEVWRTIYTIQLVRSCALWFVYLIVVPRKCMRFVNRFYTGIRHWQFGNRKNIVENDLYMTTTEQNIVQTMCTIVDKYYTCMYSMTNYPSWLSIFYFINNALYE